MPDENTDGREATTEETTVLHYQRADSSKFPTSPAGQLAAAEGTAAANGFKEQPRR